MKSLPPPGVAEEPASIYRLRIEAEHPSQKEAK